MTSPTRSTPTRPLARGPWNRPWWRSACPSTFRRPDAGEHDVLALALQQDAHTGLDAHTGRDAVGPVVARGHLLERVKATGRVLLVQEAPRRRRGRPGSWPNRGPDRRVGRPRPPRSAGQPRGAGQPAQRLDAPIPYSPELEKLPVPQVPDIMRAAAS